MCGIVGIFDLEARRAIDPELLAVMNETQVHRGPDGYGFHLEDGTGLGHRRLSIIDLSGGKQPLYNEDSSVVVTYNGEIYNFQSLAEELVGLGHTFRTRCDTEVIVHAWEQWGEACVDRFNGMFAFAVWDRNQQTLFLARDRLGIKPLYYGVTSDGFLVFGSELKALLAHPGLPSDMDLQAVEDYFAFGYVPDPKTMLTAVRKLAPGHTLRVRRGNPMAEPRQYWDVSFQPHDGTGNLESELIDRLRESVRKRLIAEVPLGAFLSGGVDSSAVVAMMAEVSSGSVNTCSISFGERQFDESTYADVIAAKYRTTHRVKRVDPDDFSLVDELVDLYDEPFADSSAIPTYRVCELAREKVTVALSGDGGDENFAGYRRHRWHALEEVVRSRVPDPIRRPVFGLLGKLYPKLDWAPRILRAKATLQAIARDSIDGYLHGVSIMPGNLQGALFSPEFRERLQGYRAIEVFREHAERAPTRDSLSLIQYLDLKTYLPGDILTKVDRASMAHSLEVRVPLLDHEFVDWVSGIDPGLKLKGREGKYVFKKALEPHLPKSILYRPKMGFGVPLCAWFRGPLREQVRDVVLGSALRDSGIFDSGTLTEIVDQHQAGIRDYSAVIWSLLMFAGFMSKRSR